MAVTTVDVNGDVDGTLGCWRRGDAEATDLGAGAP